MVLVEVVVVLSAKCGGQNSQDLRSREHNIQKLLARRHSGDIFPLSLHVGGYGECVVAVVVGFVERTAKVRSNISYR
jgi:hypothetical protein